MEENGSDVVKMAVEGEQAASRLVRPDLDLVIVATRYEQGLCLMKVDSTDWSIVLLESVDQGTHTVVPKLDGG